MISVVLKCKNFPYYLFNLPLTITLINANWQNSNKNKLQVCVRNLPINQLEEEKKRGKTEGKKEVVERKKKWKIGSK